jgi:protein kinase X
MGGAKKELDEGPPIPPTTEAKIQQFFQETHSEGGKTVQAHELVTMRSETIGERTLSAVRTIGLNSAAAAAAATQRASNFSLFVVMLPAAAAAAAAPLPASGVGNLSRVRLVEVKQMPAYLAKMGLEEMDESGRPEVSAGIFALKVTRKTEVVRLKQAEHVKSEALILSQVTHPFIVMLYHRFQDERSLYLLEEFVQGGQLDHFISKNGRLANETARFYAAQVVMAMQVLHQEHVVYRDLNPSNILLDRGLYVKLVDFGLAKVLNFDDPTARTWTLCGTPEYLAPEIIQSKGHSKEVDWWALGVIIHEMLAGYPPWYDNDAFTIYKEILNSKVTLESFPRHLETHARDLIKKLLTKERTKRIGSSKNGAEDIKKHKWYRGLNWAALYNKTMEPPLDSGMEYVPSVNGVADVRNYTAYPTSSEENGPVLDPEQDLNLFWNWESLSKEADVTSTIKR